MIGEVVEQEICDNVLDLSHGFTGLIKRLIVSDLVITIDKDAVYVFKADQMDGADVNFIDDVEVSDEVIQSAKTFLNAKEHIKKELGNILNYEK